MRGTSEAELLGQLEPDIVAAYLKRTGWEQQKSNNPDATIWSRWNAVEGREFEILLPCTGEVGDRVLRLAEAIETLSSFEGRNRLEIMADLQRRGGLTKMLREGKRSGSMADGLIRLWGLDVFGLTGLSRRTIIDLRFAAVMQSFILLFGVTLWSYLFIMILGLKLVSLALVLGTAFATGEAFYRRQLFTIDLESKRVRRIVGIVVRIAIMGLTTLLMVAPVTLIVFRIPIENRIVQEREAMPQQRVSPDDFLYKIEVLNALLKQNNDSGKTYRATYFLTVSAVVAINLLMPITMYFLRSEELIAYYSSRDKLSESNASAVVETGARVRLEKDDL